jgi:hypothetical protein
LIRNLTLLALSHHTPLGYVLGHICNDRYILRQRAGSVCTIESSLFGFSIGTVSDPSLFLFVILYILKHWVGLSIIILLSAELDRD